MKKILLIVLSLFVYQIECGEKVEKPLFTESGVVADKDFLATLAAAHFKATGDMNRSHRDITGGMKTSRYDIPKFDMDRKPRSSVEAFAHAMKPVTEATVAFGACNAAVSGLLSCIQGVAELYTPESKELLQASFDRFNGPIASSVCGAAFLVVAYDYKTRNNSEKDSDRS